MRPEIWSHTGGGGAVGGGDKGGEKGRGGGLIGGLGDPAGGGEGDAEGGGGEGDAEGGGGEGDAEGGGGEGAGSLLCYRCRPTSRTHPRRICGRECLAAFTRRVPEVMKREILDNIGPEKRRQAQ